MYMEIKGKKPSCDIVATWLDAVIFNEKVKWGLVHMFSLDNSVSVFVCLSIM